jgi:hypothetical protein
MKCPFCSEELIELHKDLYDCTICNIMITDTEEE